MVDEEEDGQKENKDAEQKEGSSGTSGGVEEEGSGEVKDDSKQAPETPGSRAAQAGPARVSRGTDEENGEKLEQLTTEPREAAGGEAEARAAGSEQDEVFVWLVLSALLGGGACARVHARACTRVHSHAYGIIQD